MKTSDADTVQDVMRAAFADLDARLGRPVEPPPADRAPGRRRITHPVETDPGGAWVAEDDAGRIVGAALAIVREGLWGLSLLVVSPAAQSGGHGKALLQAAVAYGDGTRGGLILASEDARALRSYWRAGFALRPAFDALGPLAGAPWPEAVRAARWPQDAGLVDAAARRARGAAVAGDITPSLETGARLWIHARGGYAVTRGGAVATVCAEDPAAARELLRAAALAAGENGREVHVGFVEAAQQWAVDEVLELGLRLRPGGAVAVRGDVGPLHPYIPSGAYL